MDSFDYVIPLPEQSEDPVDPRPLEPCVHTTLDDSDIYNDFFVIPTVVAPRHNVSSRTSTDPIVLQWRGSRPATQYSVSERDPPLATAGPAPPVL